MTDFSNRLKELNTEYRGKKIRHEKQLDDIQTNKKMLETAKDEYRELIQKNRSIISGMAYHGLGINQVLALEDALYAEISSIDRTLALKDEEFETERRAVNNEIEDDFVVYKNQCYLINIDQEASTV